MAQMNLPAAPSYKRTSYSGLLGCDFSVDPSLVSRKRSPDCLNMISDNGGNPVKRPGWEVVRTASGSSVKVDNVWMFKVDAGDSVLIACAYTVGGELACVYKDGDTITDVSFGSTITVPSGRLGAFYSDTSDTQYGLYILAGSNFHRIYYVNNAFHHEEVSPKVPTVTIARTPTGGGEVFEEFNLLSNRVTEQFINTSGNKTFLLSYAPLASGVQVWHKDGSSWVQETGTITVDTSAHTVTLATAYTPVPASEDNIRITYTISGTSTASTILKCTECAHFSHTLQDQIFVTGNPDKRNTIYYSYHNDVTYFPDTYYLKVNGETNIKGFLNVGEYLAAVKEGSAMDSTVFLIYPTSLSSTTEEVTTGSDGNLTTKSKTKTDWTFGIKRSIAGVGAISDRAFSILGDEPLFMSSRGIYGIATVDTTSEKIVRNRSFLLDQKLTREAGLEKAVATVWKNYYVLVVNGHAYILDGRHKNNNYQGNTSYGYESYYWENIPAISIASCEDELWFGTADGRLCRFKNSGQAEDYSDNTVATQRVETAFYPAESVVDSNILIAQNLSSSLLDTYRVGAIMYISKDGSGVYRGITRVETVGDVTTFTLSENITVDTTYTCEYYGDVVIARWSTPLDNDDMSEYFKTMQKKGTMCTVAPYERSSVTVYIDVDGHGRTWIGHANADRSDLFDGVVDFERLSFDTSTAPRDYFFRKKRKKYKRLQIILENDIPNEPFGVFEIVKTYIYQRFAK